MSVWFHHMLGRYGLTELCYNSAITSNAHRLLPHNGTTMKLYGPITIARLRFAMENSISIDSDTSKTVIDRITNDNYYSQDINLEKISAIFIHDLVKGIAMIKSNNSELEEILSVRV